jgi:hypothetical protein
MLATEESLTRLTTVPSEQEAAIIVAALNDEGIDACYMGETTANFRAGVPGQIHVYVSEAEFRHAKELLEATERSVDDQIHVEEDKPSAIRQLVWIALVLLVLFLMLLIGLG